MHKNISYIKISENFVKKIFPIKNGKINFPNIFTSKEEC